MPNPKSTERELMEAVVKAATEVLRYDGGEASECYHAIKLYDARFKLRESLAALHRRTGEG